MYVTVCLYNEIHIQSYNGKIELAKVKAICNQQFNLVPATSLTGITFESNIALDSLNFQKYDFMVKLSVEQMFF